MESTEKLPDAPGGGAFSATELDEAFAEFQRTVAEVAVSGDWDRYADMFTEDADFVEHALGTLRGREEIRAWAWRTMTAFPGSHMTGFPSLWHVVDAPTGRVICEVDNPMRDPGGTRASSPPRTSPSSPMRATVCGAARRMSTTRWSSAGQRCGGVRKPANTAISMSPPPRGWRPAAPSSPGPTRRADAGKKIPPPTCDEATEPIAQDNRDRHHRARS